MFCPKCGSPIPEDAVFCMNCGEKIETAAPEADSAPAEITPAEEAPIPASGKKPKKKKAVLLVSVLALLLVAVALANSSLFQSNIAAKAEKRIVGSWNGVFLENGDDIIRAKISVALPAPLKRVVRLQFHSQNAPFLIYPLLNLQSRENKSYE